MTPQTISIGADHAGFEAKELIKKELQSIFPEVQVRDVGTFSEASVDYPDFAHQVATQVSEGLSEAGILICGSGNGVCITANKHKGIRAALTWTKELASLSRQHNNANILCVPSRFVNSEIINEMVKAFLTTEFEGGRHAKRADKIEINQ